MSEPKNRKCKYISKYNCEWEKEVTFRGWVRKSNKGPYNAYCCACDCDLKITSGKSDLIKHASGKKHVSNCAGVKKQMKLSDMPSVSSKSKLNETVMTSEIRLAIFVAEHDLPIRVTEHLPNLIKSVCPDSEVAKHIQCGRTKLTGIINHVTGRQA